MNWTLINRKEGRQTLAALVYGGILIRTVEYFWRDEGIAMSESTVFVPVQDPEEAKHWVDDHEVAR